MREIPTPEYDDPKELWAVFGLTFYWAQVLEQGVLNLAVALRVAGKGGFDWSSVKELSEVLEKKTFGAVLRVARELMPIPPDLDDQLGLALDRRNHLAHHFFVDRAHEFQSEVGRNKAIDDLLRDMALFQDVDLRFDPIWQEAWARLGITEAHNERLRRVLDGGSPAVIVAEMKAIADEIKAFAE